MPEQDHTIELISLIDEKTSHVNTTSLDLSFNEILDMYKDRELNISPEFQRLFRWSEGSRSRFIESLLLELPVPPIYVIEEESRKYILIDGLQRISSYLHLRGELTADHLNPPIRPGDFLTLTDCDIVPELNGTKYSDLATALQIKLKRAFVRVEVVRKGSNPRFKYHMFKRLNTGGATLSEQQIRNCTIRLLDSKFNDLIIELSRNADFLVTTSILTEDRRLSAFDQELVLRFFALKNWRDKFKHDVSDFLTEYMEAVSDPEIGLPFDYQAERQNFEKTFKVLNKTMNEFAFAFATRTLQTLTRGFSANHFEAFTLGIQPHLDRLDPDDDAQMQRLQVEFSAIKKDPTFYAITTGGGKNSPGPLNARISFVNNWLTQKLTP
jgi:hypothetical protein